MDVSLVVAGAAALAAAVSAAATVVMARFSWRLARSTEDYVRLTQEQLKLIRAQAAPPLLLDVAYISGASPELLATCRHSGNSSSLAAILKAVQVRICPLDNGERDEIADTQRLNDYLFKPGKTWSGRVAKEIAATIAVLRAPRSRRSWFRRQSVGRLSVTLEFQRAGQNGIEQVTREYDVRTAFFPGPMLYRLPSD
jgi:hypothetical protein